MKISYIGKTLLIKVNGKKILVVGDLHLGYEEYLNNSGIFVSRQMFKEIISEFEEIFSKVEKVEQIVLLGDVKHDFGTITKQEWNDALRLFDYLLEKGEKIVVVKGNHDKILKWIVNKKERVEMKESYVVSGVCFVHGDKRIDTVESKKIKVLIIGHGHPAVGLGELGGIKREKYKCFLVGKWKRKKVIVVPSFFSYFEGSDARESDLRLAWKFNFDRFNVKVVSRGLEVLDFGRLGEMGKFK